MALSPADFYAYSRATGVPVPEDPQERAEMAPEVLEFRRNQLKKPQESPNALATVGTAALGLGAAIGAGLAARRFMRGRGQIPQGPTRAANAGVVQQDLSTLRRAAEATRPASEPVAPSRPAPGTAEEEFVAYRPDPRELVSRQVADARRQAATEELLRATAARRGIYQLEIPGVKATLIELRSPAAVSAKETGELIAQAESRPLSAAPAQQDLFDPTNRLLEELGQMQASRKQALESRMSRAYGQRLQKTADELLTQLAAEGPDLTDIQQATRPAQTQQFIAAVESGEDQASGRMKHRLQQNEDLDMSQVELLEEMAERGRVEAMEQDEPITLAASQLSDGIPVDQTEVARSLTSQELADIAKSEMMQRRQELTERGLRPGTTSFERALAQGWASKPGLVPGTEEFRQNISLPATVRKAVEAESANAGPMGFIPERTVLNIGPQAKVTSTAAGTAIRGASPSLYEVLPKVEERQLYGTGDPLVFDVPEEMGPDIGGKGARVRGAMPADIPETEMSKQEIQYSFLNKPPAAEQPGGAGGIGVYGIEPAYVPGAMSKVTGEFSAAAERKPTYVPGWLQKKQMSSGFEALSTPQLMAAAEKTTAPRIQQAFQSEIQRRKTAEESIAVSEVLRRARIEGRDPQDFLRNFGRNI